MYLKSNLYSSSTTDPHNVTHQNILSAWIEDIKSVSVILNRTLIISISMQFRHAD